MILIDFSGMIIASMTAMYSKNLTLDMVRHATLQSILFAKNKFGSKYGEIVFACDDKNNWRRTTFPYYKANRKKDRSDSSMDWNMMLGYLNELKAEFKENLPYKFLQVDTAEADDIIASLVREYTAEPKMIYSSDGDFQQLLRYPNTDLYSPRLKKQVRCPDPHKYLLEHVMEGDSSDGVPNMLSQDNTFVEKIRQKRLTAKFKEKHLPQLLQGQLPFTGDDLVRFNRNRRMIDMTQIPEDIIQLSIEQYKSASVPDRSRLFPYFFGKQMTKLMERLQEF